MDNERMVRMLELKINVFEGIIGLFKASWSRVPCLAEQVGLNPFYHYNSIANKTGKIL